MKQAIQFLTIRTEGGLLPVDILQRVLAGDKTLSGTDQTTYHLAPEDRRNEVITRSWNRLLMCWLRFKEALSDLPKNDPGTSITREKWLLPLFQELGYGRLQTVKPFEHETKLYPVSHLWQKVPIQLVGAGMKLDKRFTLQDGKTVRSPHSMLQEFLNWNDDFLWAFVSNGFQLRILRDNVSLTRQAFVEFDLEAMMEGEVFSDFVLLWLLCHQSRVETEIPEHCFLETWSRSAGEQGVRMLEQLREGVEKAICALGSGLLSHSQNTDLKTKLRSGDLSLQDFYRQLLRLIYRLIFLFVAEERDLLVNPDADPKQKELYYRYYSLSRIRTIAEQNLIGTHHSDMWQGIGVLFSRLYRDGIPELAIPALGSFLWSDQAIPDLKTAQISNRYLLTAIRALSMTIEQNVRRRVSYKELGSEELGSIYEALLEYHPRLEVEAGTFHLENLAGNERKSTGSYYTPSRSLSDWANYSFPIPSLKFTIAQ